MKNHGCGGGTLEPVVRGSLLCLALAMAGCGDDGAPVAPVADVDAGSDAGPSDGGTTDTGESSVVDTTSAVDTTSGVSTSGATATTSNTGGETRAVVPDAGPDAASTQVEVEAGGGGGSGDSTSRDDADAGDAGSVAPLITCASEGACVTNPKAIAVGAQHTCVAVANGDVYCWGDNQYGQLGDGSVAPSVSPVKVSGVSDVVALSAGGSFTCAATEAGQVNCWGSHPWSEDVNFGLTPERVGQLNDVVSISSGSDHTCAVTEAGQVYCWGLNFSGILGDEAAPSGKEPVLVEGLEGVKAIVATDMTNCALRDNGSAACWGSNYFGLLGDGSEVDPNDYYAYSATPVDVVELTDAVTIVGHRESFCALRADGGVSCWGVVPEFITGSSHSTPVAMPDLGEVVGLFGNSGGFCVTRPDQTAACWGYNGEGGLGNGSLQSSATPVTVSGLTDVVAVVGSSAALHSCALRSNGSVACWGRNDAGQLGGGEVGLGQSSTPVEVAGDAVFVGLSVGNNHSCGVTATGRVSCWGVNYDGELGNGQAWLPESTPAALPNIDDATAVVAGNSLTCVLREGGAVDCLGSNSYGQVGDGATEPRVAPTSVVGLDDAAGVSTCFNSACAVRTDGTVQCWGDNSSGVLGTDPSAENGVASSSVPVTIDGVTDAVQVSAGRMTSCALTNAGAVQCWGLLFANSEEWTPATYLPPTLVAGIEDATALSSGTGVTCAVLGDGTVQCWGMAGSGGLPAELPGDSLTPVTIDGLTDVAQVAVGYEHVCARRVNGTVACWGSRSGGILGDGLPITYDEYSEDAVAYTPVEVVGLTDVTNLAVGDNHSCATVASGKTYCWGRNFGGMLGSGETPYSTLPVNVVWP